MPQAAAAPAPTGTGRPDERQLRGRYRRIMRLATRTLVREWWFELVLPRIGLRRVSVKSRPERMRRFARRFHDLAVDLGGLMIKVGQFMSSRLDVLPPEVTRELEGLQDEVAPADFAGIRALAEAELGLPLAEAYRWFDPQPIAAASLGQAHRARLSPAIASDVGFEQVVVKVQRPGIAEIVAVDLSALRRVARILSRVRMVSTRVDVPALVEEFAATSLAEIDYLHEASNAERFRADFEGDERVTAPEVVWDRTTLRVLTLADVTAIKITDVAALRAAGIAPDAVADELARATFQQIFVAGFFHADPHPGNIFVTPDAGGATGWRLTFVDFGMMGEIDDRLRAGLRDFILAVVARDGRALVASLERLGVLLPGADTEELERAMSASFDRFGGMGVAELRAVDPRDLEAFARQFGDTVRTLPFQLPEDFLLLIRTISLVSGVTSALNPRFNMWDAVDPFARTVLLGSNRDLRAIGQQALGYATTVARLPQRLDQLATRIDRGQLAIRAPGVERRISSIEATLRRLISAIVFAALLFSGVLLRRGGDDVIAWVLMAASVVPLLHLLVTWRRR
ncbi:AarF/ABC1/UbiB kinase family protein [Protaetiibacter sp. SSC-01]|uniref:ABC1 kinase family protein n=1 Tax=Protaetiibacter sp. SSC-01 TaxID=2759943 RepID=UPI001656CCBF|nr:AarF/UbiB family protein [Protaetiibacter sp. SSC-01]QNO38123.1 AarF/ABC1/UbiB kinase family protein [Protaetiibacter sp. SSC-01]